VITMNTTPCHTAACARDDQNTPYEEVLRDVAEEPDQEPDPRPPVRVPSPAQAARRMGASLGLTEEEIRAVEAELAERGLHVVTSYPAWLRTELSKSACRKRTAARTPGADRSTGQTEAA
jgi:hypothetical protein